MKQGDIIALFNSTGYYHTLFYEGNGKAADCTSGRSDNIQSIWQPDYENFMNTVGFNTRLCKPRHPYTKGKVERLIRFIKDNFLVGRCFWNLNDLNDQAMEWCEKQNSKYHREIEDISGLSALGPTIDSSPFNILNNCGISSIFVKRLNICTLKSG